MTELEQKRQELLNAFSKLEPCNVEICEPCAEDITKLNAIYFKADAPADKMHEIFNSIDKSLKVGIKTSDYMFFIEE